MNAASFLLRLPMYKAYKRAEFPGVLPFSYVFLLSTKCNSRCKTCGLWKVPSHDELSLNDWLKVIESIGNRAAWVTVTGGEPFMIPGIDKILCTVLQKTKPMVLCIPTNASMPPTIYKTLGRVLVTPGKYELIVNISVDEVGEKHDQIRGLTGGFAKVLETVKVLRRLRARFPQLRIGINTVISEWNIDRIDKIHNYVFTQIRPDDHIFEIAQERVELNSSNVGLGLTDLRVVKFLRQLSAENRMAAFRKRGVSAFKAISRARYYISILHQKEARCNAGLLSCQIMPNGDVVDCGTRGDVMANVKSFGFDFSKLWQSPGPAKARAIYRKRRCKCQLANIFYINRF